MPILNRVKINLKYFTIKEFLNLDLNENYLSLFHVNIVSLKKYIDDLHNLLNIIKLQTQVIGICEHKIKKDFYLNGSLPGYTFESEPATSTHGGVGFFINDNLCYKVRNYLKMLSNGYLEPIFIEVSYDKKKKNIVGLIYWHPHMLINDFCDNFLIGCLYKITLFDNTCILIGDFIIDLLKLHANNFTSKFLEVMTSCFDVLYIQEPTRVVGSSATLIDNDFMNSVKFVTVSGNLLCHLADHLLQFGVFKDFKVSYRPKHEQIF